MIMCQCLKVFLVICVVIGPFQMEVRGAGLHSLEDKTAPTTQCWCTECQWEPQLQNSYQGNQSQVIISIFILLGTRYFLQVSGAKDFFFTRHGSFIQSPRSSRRRCLPSFQVNLFRASCVKTNRHNSTAQDVCKDPGDENFFSLEVQFMCPQQPMLLNTIKASPMGSRSMEHKCV